MSDPKKTASQLTKLFIGLAELVLGLRVVFLLINADQSSKFVQWVYSISAPLLDPVRGIIQASEFSQRFVLDFRSLLAMAFWAVVGLLALGLIDWIRTPQDSNTPRWQFWHSK